MREITADPEVLLDQAGMTAETYLRRAMSHVLATVPPELSEGESRIIAAMILASAIDFHTSILVSAIQDLTKTIRDESLAHRGVID